MHTRQSGVERTGPRLMANRQGYLWMRFPEAEIISRVDRPVLGKGRHRPKWWKLGRS